MDNELYFTEHKEAMSLSDFDRFFDILCESFPKEEHRYYENQMELLDNENYRIWLIYWRKEIVGILAFWEFDGFTYLEHFAVATAFQNCHIGTWAFNKFKELYSNIVLEVELPRTVNAKRRIMFYKKNGLDLHAEFVYEMLPLEPEFTKQQFILMTIGQKYSVAQLGEIRDILYATVYKKAD